MLQGKHRVSVHHFNSSVVARADQEEWDAGAEFSRVDAANTWLELVTEGAGTLTLGAVEYEIRSGMLFAHDGTSRPRITVGDRAPLILHLIELVGDGPRQLLEEYGPAPGAAQLTSAVVEMRDLFSELANLHGREGTNVVRIRELVLERLVLRAAETARAAEVDRGAAHTTYLRCRALIEERWAEFATLEEVADEIRVDPAYMCRLFRRFDSASPYQYLLHSKIRSAAEALRQPGATVKAVAAAHGFGDPHHFSRVFRRIVGMPPSQYGRAHRSVDSVPSSHVPVGSEANALEALGSGSL